MMVIDGNSIINRAFYGVRPLSTKDGQATNALFGFLNILQKLLDDNKPDGLCVTFDVHAPTFRHEKYAEYKGQRKPMPEELRTQMPILKELLDAMNIPHYELAGWEADDLIGTIAAKCEQGNWECAVVTGDKDSLQLVTDLTHVLLVTTRMGQTTTKEVTPESFKEEYGFPPRVMIDLKALMGDSSDNYPGVSGIGEKTAMALLQENGTLDEIYTKLEEETLNAKPAALKRLAAGKADAYFSYELATIRTDAPIEMDLNDALRKAPDNDALYQLFLRLEFSKFIEKYGLKPSESVPVYEKKEIVFESETVKDPARVESLLRELREKELTSFVVRDDLSAIAVDWEERSAFLCSADLGESYEQFLRGYFSNEIKKIGHDIKNTMHMLVEHGLPTEGFIFDTALAAYLLAPTDGSYELEKLFIGYFNCEINPKEDYNSEDVFTAFTLDVQARILAENTMLARASAVWALYEVLKEKLEECGMTSLLMDIEIPLCSVLAEMECNGFFVDRKALREYGKLLTAQIEQDQKMIYEYANHEFNINSTQQLGQVLFEELGLPAVKKTKRGYSTSAEVLEKLSGQHPIIASILEYRQMTKLNSTYVEGLEKVIGEDGRIHTSFQNTVTATGRLSSTEPNLQNIPVRTQIGAEMRKMFQAKEGCVLVDADYSQIELRLLAHIANDENMIDAFVSGYDIHTATAAKVFGVVIEDVTPQMRRSAKAVNFGIVYGISSFSLSQDIGVSVAEAKTYMNSYFDKYSGVKEYMTKVVEKAKADGYVSTLFGRRRALPELKSSNFNLRAFGERVALNMPIQGTAADIIKIAMIRVNRRLKEEGLEAKLVLQVHDELIVECPESEAEKVKKLLEDEMAGVVAYRVPLVAEGGIGKTWAEAH